MLLHSVLLIISLFEYDLRVFINCKLLTIKSVMLNSNERIKVIYFQKEDNESTSLLKKARKNFLVQFHDYGLMKREPFDHKNKK